MCGIFGVYGARDTALLASMRDRLSHRGPDGHGEFLADDMSLGHVRLSIIDVEKGAQPLTNETGELQIVVNGEIYNHRQLRSELSGHTFATDSDSEVILHLYEEFGLDGFAKLDGMFAFAIYDHGDLILCRDPIGIKPLYYARDGDRLWFASELKALLPVAGQVEEFPNGCTYHSRTGLQRYHQLAGEERPGEDFTACTRRVADLLDRSVHKRLMSDVPLGVFLSGGLDSSLTSMLARRHIDDLHSFSVGFPWGADIEHSRTMAEFLKTKHHHYALDKQEMAARLPEVIYHLESYDAALVRSAVPNYFLCQLAAEYVTVVLSGEGADELFGGYAYLWEHLAREALNEELFLITSNLHNTNLQRTDRMTMAHGLEGRVPFLDCELVRAGLAIPERFKMNIDRKREKHVLKEAFAGDLPASILDRTKEKFSAGAGSAQVLAEYAEDHVSDADLRALRNLSWGDYFDSKEKVLYYRIFQDHFGDALSPEICGISRSL